MSIDNAKGIRIKQMTEYTASIAVLVGFFFSPYRKPEKPHMGKEYTIQNTVLQLCVLK